MQKDKAINIYTYLNDMAVKGYIPQEDYVNILTDTEIFKLLSNLEIDYYKSLTPIEKQQLLYFKKLYFKFDKNESLLQNNIYEGVKNWVYGNDISFFKYQDSLFTLRFNPILSVGYKKYKDETQKYFSWGVDYFGKIGDNFGFRMDFTDNSIDAINYDPKQTFENSNGKIYTRANKNHYEFSETNGSITYHNSFLTLSFAKEKFTFGQGINGQLVLSDKAPSFPMIYLKLSPTDWLKFYYMHGWLISGVTDSGKIYDTELNPRRSEKEKYWAMHALQIIPIPQLSLTLGETILYSDRGIYGGYLIPFVFFRSVDHQFSYGSGDSGNNGSIFAEISGNPINGVNLYFSTFIDELSLEKLLKGETDRNQLGYTIGTKFLTPYFDNLRLAVEYTKILPWVYSNWIPTQTYRNANYLMGHYIGQNADQIYVEARYYPLYNLEIIGKFSHTRNGSFGKIYDQYNPPGEPFLYGLLRKQTDITISANYEFLYRLFANINYTHTKITDQDTKRTPKFMLGDNNSLSFMLQYGF
jgi:hypothetical protein